jgi:hypothetical protein
MPRPDRLLSGAQSGQVWRRLAPPSTTTSTESEPVGTLNLSVGSGHPREEVSVRMAKDLEDLWWRRGGIDRIVSGFVEVAVEPDPSSATSHGHAPLGGNGRSPATRSGVRRVWQHESFVYPAFAELPDDTHPDEDALDHRRSNHLRLSLHSQAPDDQPGAGPMRRQSLGPYASASQPSHKRPLRDRLGPRRDEPPTHAAAHYGRLQSRPGRGRLRGWRHCSLSSRGCRDSDVEYHVGLLPRRAARAASPFALGSYADRQDLPRSRHHRPRQRHPVRAGYG